MKEWRKARWGGEDRAPESRTESVEGGGSAREKAKEGEEQMGRNEVGGRDGEGGEREGRRAAYQPVNSNSVHTLTRTYLVRLARRWRKRHAPRLPHRRRRP